MGILQRKGSLKCTRYQAYVKLLETSRKLESLAQRIIQEGQPSDEAIRKSQWTSFTADMGRHASGLELTSCWEETEHKRQRRSLSKLLKKSKFLRKLWCQSCRNNFLNDIEANEQGCKVQDTSVNLANVRQRSINSSRRQSTRNGRPRSSLWHIAPIQG